ncbi:hypothetical protein [Gordonia sp. VNK21]|uniref:hypothetical protein n=1 Tax=Gordonia sp. VNK21 TaxID=3382483 RepID=UPI0038D440C6
MVDSGGTAAAFGFSFQYLATAAYVLNLLCTTEIDPRTVTLVVEPPGAIESDVPDDDIVDFAVLVDGVVYRSVQVKASRRPADRTLAPAEANRVFERLETLGDTGASLLITNRHLAPSLSAQCSTAVDDPVGSAVRWTGGADAQAASERPILITKNVADLEAIYEDLVRAFRRDNARSQGIVSSRLVGVLLRHRIFEAAAGHQPNRISGDELLAVLTMRDAQIAHAVGGFDWGNPESRIPNVKSPVPRLDVLNDIGAQLDIDDRTPPVVVLTGHTGIGKSILATDFCHLNHNRYEHVLWLDARDDGLLLAQIREYAARLTDTPEDAVTDPVNLFSRALGAQRGPWLVVFDAAPGRREIERFVPTLGHGAVLVTTTNSTGWWPTAHVREVGPFDSAEAMMCFASYAGINDADVPAVAATIQAIVDRLGSIPLAISMAGLYFRNADSDLAELAPTYFATLDALDDTLAIPPGFNRTAFAAVTTAVNQIGADSNSPYTRNARILMHTASFLAPEMIPLNLMIPATSDPITIDMARLPAPSAADPHQMRAIVSLLRTQTIAHRVLASAHAGSENLSADCIQIHPLINEILRTQYVASAPPGAVQNAVTVLLGHLIPWLGLMRTTGSFLALEQLRIHAETLIEYLDSQEPLSSLSTQHDRVYLTAKAGVMGELANCYGNTARLDQAIKLQNRLVVHYLRHFPNEEWAQVLAMIHAGNMLTDMSRASVAPQPLFQIAGRVLGLMEILEGREKPSTKAAVYRTAHLSVQMVTREQEYRENSMLAGVAAAMGEIAERDPNKGVSPEWLMRQMNTRIEHGDYGAVLAALQQLRAIDSSLNDAIALDALEITALLHTGDLDTAFAQVDRLLSTEVIQNHLVLDLRSALAKVFQALHQVGEQHCSDPRFRHNADRVRTQIATLDAAIAAVQPPQS